MLKWFLRQDWFVAIVTSNQTIMLFVNKLAIHRFVNRVKVKRPYVHALGSDCVTWTSMYEKEYTARQLPEDDQQRDLPPVEEVVELWRRPKGEIILSDNTSVYFAYFAQWFSDSFMRTNLQDRKKNISNHEIDFCQIYGSNEKATDILRLKKDGKLRYQMINGQMFPPFLFSDKVTQDSFKTNGSMLPNREIFGKGAEDDEGDLPNFSELHPWPTLVSIYSKQSNEALPKMFVTGLEHGNSSIGYASMCVICLREHNRICDEFLSHADEYGLNEMSEAQRDEFIFQKVRLIMTVILLKIVVGEYVPHLGGLSFPFQLDPNVGEGHPWKRTNRVSIEFNLLYRWHSLIPDQIRVGDEKLDQSEFRFNSDPVIKNLDEVITSASHQAAGQIGLLNSHELFFYPMLKQEVGPREGGSKYVSIQHQTVQMARDANLQPMNAYRKVYGIDPITSFDQLSSKPYIQQQLKDLYGTPDNIELLPGMFAEEPEEGHMLGELMKRMVAYDAFTHVFSNPLLTKGVFKEETFTSLGASVIKDTNTISDVVNRNSGVSLSNCFQFVN